MELTLLSLLEAMGGWVVVIKVGAVVAFVSMFRSGYKSLKNKEPNGFVKRGLSFVASAVVAFLWTGTEEIGHHTVTLFFCSTILWNVAIKPMLNKLGENWKTSGDNAP